MDKQTKTRIKNMVLSLRDDFEKEIGNRLNNIGIYPDKDWKDGRSLPHLSKNELEKRKHVAAFILREEKIGLDRKKATEEFIKEASYTWINRLLGLKCLECWGLIEEVITTRPEYGSRSKSHRDFREKNSEQAAQPDDGLTGCLFSAFEEVTKEIKVLFDPDNEYSLVIPRYPLLKKAIETINGELDYDTYRQDDFLGWVYQYFNSREKDRVFEEVRTKKKKISGSDIINVTQLYTEKYMVRFLVENSLGAMWMEMYPDSHLCDRWEYFVRDPNNSTREPKPIQEITFLDPACGSGHFLLYAFDLYYDMYLEEGSIPHDQIPEFILRHNLHGIDIDLRAIQLSALALYLKAKSRNPDMVVQHMNLVSADAIMLDSDILDEFLQDFQDATAQELIKTIWQGLENVRELGSLLKVEEQIDEVIERQKDRRLDFFDKGSAKSWEQWKRDLLAALKGYYEKAAQTFDINKQMFANEACKGVQLLDLLEQRYDVVATNPPYMHGRNMGRTLKSDIKSLYPKNSSDLYAVFIERCVQFTGYKGFIAMITQQSFMFINSYVALRKYLLENCLIRNMAHLGPHSFEDISGEKVNSTMFSMINLKNDESKSIFFRLINEEEKEKNLTRLINSEVVNKDKLFIIYQDNFKIIPGWPLVYWVDNKIRDLFSIQSKLDSIVEFANRTKTSDNEEYTRYYWEPKESIGQNCKWVLYTKGGEFNKWYGNNDILINWSKEARDFFRKSPKGRITDEIYWFREGITYSSTSGKGFGCRLIPPLCVYDVKGPAIFSKTNDNIYFLLGLFNSKIISYILEMLNPTIEVQSGDIERVPFCPPPLDTKRRVSALAKQCVNIKKDAVQFVLTDREFKQTAILWGYNQSLGVEEEINE